MDLEGALLASLRPHGVRERVRGWVARGWTAAQVHARLPEDVRAALAAEERQPVERVHRDLLALASAGRVRTRRVHYTVELNTKGARGMVVDVFWTA